MVGAILFERYMPRYQPICPRSRLSVIAGAPRLNVNFVTRTPTYIGAEANQELCCYEAKKRVGVTGKVIE